VRGGWLIPLGIALGVVVAASAKGKDDGLGEDRPDPPVLPPDISQGETQALIRQMAETLGLDSQWSAFLEAAAMGESGMNPLAGRGIEQGAPPWAQINDSDAEAYAAQRAYNRNRWRFEDCPWPEERYTFGSGGLWAQLPANHLPAFADTEAICMSPWAVFYPPRALVMLLGYLRRSMRRESFQSVPTWGNLRVSMRAPSKMGRESELERMRTGKNKLGDRYEQLGYPRSLVDEPVTPLPDLDSLTALSLIEDLT
jgi:hypothetical protein